MVPQGVQSGGWPQHQHSGLPSFMPSNPFDPSPYFNNLDPTQAAKQMAALTAASQARMANSRPATVLNPLNGTNSAPLLGGTNGPSYPTANYDLSSGSSTQTATFQSLPTSIPTSLLDSMSYSAPRIAPQVSQSLTQRKQIFLNGLANIMASAGDPLPPALSGVPAPTYDPNSSKWKNWEPSPEIGCLRLAGKDVGLFQLWGSVFQSGGGDAVAANDGWSAFLPQFGLPEEIPQVPPKAGTISVAHMISELYMTMLLPFEQLYKSNMQDQQKRALASRQGGELERAQASGHNRLPSSLQKGPTAQPIAGMKLLPVPRPPTPESCIPIPGSFAYELQASGLVADTMVVDQELSAMKRKMEHDEHDVKRTRQKIGSEPPLDNSVVSAISTRVDRSSPSTPTTMPPPPRPRQQPSRRKIEYIPLAREVDTYGGRDLKFLEPESPQRRPIRDINDWGTVDIEALAMSIRSRLAAELSYALTTFTLLSTMRGQTPGSGFPVFQSPDLFDEVLDLLEEQAFGDVKDPANDTPPTDFLALTHRELVNSVYEAENQPFAALAFQQGSQDMSLGNRQRPGNVVLAILNIIRNLSTVQDNQEFLSRHIRLIDLMLRLCTVVHGECGTPTPLSTALSLNDLVHLRRDVLYTLTNIASNIKLSTSSSRVTTRMAVRVFDLVSSYLIDPIEAVPPLACVQLSGTPLTGTLKPPALADTALDVFSRLSQADSNRQIFSKAIPQTPIVHLFTALIHRLPVVDADFQLMTRETWLSYLEKTVIGIYSLAFLAPPDVKQKLKANRALGFKTVMLRMIQKFLMTHDSRLWFGVCTRRVVETMKILDDAEDCFDTSKSAVPTMSFGMGFGDIGDNSYEKGTGLLGGHRDVAWEMLMLREVQADEILFGELESLSRVEC